MLSFLSSSAQAQSLSGEQQMMGGGQDSAGDNKEKRPQGLSRASTHQSTATKHRSPTVTPRTSLVSAGNENPSDAKDAVLKHQWTESSLVGTKEKEKEKKKGVSFLSRILGPTKSRQSRSDSGSLAFGHSNSAIDEDDDTSVAGGFRPEGMNAQLFSHSADHVGFSPRYPQPPGYIKVRSKFKKERQFNRVFLAQELRLERSKEPDAAVVMVEGGERSVEEAKGGEVKPATATSGTATRRLNSESKNDAVWAMEFSKDGKYLAAAGQDKIVRIWAVISSREERRMHERQEEASHGAADGARQHLSAPVFRRDPIREYEGHTSTVIDLSWSKNNFLLSSSFDKTVRLWHVSRLECLVTFKHAEYCPSIAFHPRDDRFFLVGSLDTKLRLWSIPDKSVAFWNQLPEMITAVAFTPDGKTAIAGTMGGSCHFYDTEGLKYKTQINIKSSGRNAKPAKITGIKTINWADDYNHTPGSGALNRVGSSHHLPPSPTRSLTRDVKLLISSNDSRIRLYNFRDKSLEMKFKAHKNIASQIRASLSDDSGFVISGSEDRKTYIWSTGPMQEGKKQRTVEMFEAHKTMTTGAILAPRKTRMALSGSEDPLYDLCNPPPVTLISRSESVRTGSHISGAATQHNEDDAFNDATNGDTGTGSIQATPATAEGNGTFKRAEESPAYIARSAHMAGHIIVTADYAGNIKVFRQDCAHSKRKADVWGDSASAFSRRSRRMTGSMGGSAVAGSRLGRTLTGGSKSRNSVAGSIDSSRSRAGSAATQPPGERILSWRQGIASTPSSSSLERSSSVAMRAKAAEQAGRQRSASPTKSFATAASIGPLRNGDCSPGLASRGSNAMTKPRPAMAPPSNPDLSITAPTPTSPRGIQNLRMDGMKRVASPEPISGDEDAEPRRQRSHEEANPMGISGHKSYFFWNSNQHVKAQGDRAAPDSGDGVSALGGADVRNLRPPPRPATPRLDLTKIDTVISSLSSDNNCVLSDDDDDDDDDVNDDEGEDGPYAEGEKVSW